MSIESIMRITQLEEEVRQLRLMLTGARNAMLEVQEHIQNGDWEAAEQQLRDLLDESNR